MIKAERLKELIEKESTIYAIINEEIITIDFGKKFETVTKYFIGVIFGEDEVEIDYKINNFNLIKNVSENGVNLFVLEFKLLFETKSEAEFYAKYGNIEKIVKMPVPPTWEEIINNKINIINIKPYFIVIDFPYQRDCGCIELFSIKNNIVYSIKITYEFIEYNYYKILDKMVELWREEV